VKGRVIIGNAGAEYGVRGYVSAYDAETGALAWRTYIVPGDPSRPFESPELERAARTWTGDWCKLGGGGTVWDALAFDPDLDLLYVGTGNGSRWNQRWRSPQGGDNLYLSFILALRPDTGEYVWHYQTTPGDTWDFTATQHMIATPPPRDSLTPRSAALICSAVRPRAAAPGRRGDRGRGPRPADTGRAWDRNIGEDAVNQVRGRSVIRRPPHLGQKPRPLHENATRRSVVHPRHRKWAKPPASHRQRKRARNSPSTNRGSPSPSRRRAACDRKVST
jgi:hypothetical protein